MEVYPETIQRLVAPYRQEARKWVAAEKSPIGRAKYEVSLAVVEEALFDAAKAGADIYNVQVPFKLPVLLKMYEDTCKLSIADANSFMCEGWSRACWYASGEKVFEVSPALSDFLWATDIRNVKCDLLKLPYKSLYIRVPKNAGLVIPAPVAENVVDAVNRWGKDGDKLLPTGEVKVEGMFITESTVPEERSALPSNKRVLDPAKWKRSWLFVIVAEGGPQQAGAMKDKTFYTFEMPLPENESVETAVAIREDAIHDEQFRGKYRADEVWRRYFEWAMNVMLYVTYEPNPDIEERWENKDAEMLRRRLLRTPEGKEKKRLKERLKGMNLQRRIYVGRHHCLLEEAEHVEEKRPPGAGVPLAVRILVTGHWRNQAYGTGRQDHKLIWIRPFWKGPKGAPISNARRIVT